MLAFRSLLLVIIIAACRLDAADWPDAGGGPGRTWVARESLLLPLAAWWRHTPSAPPQSAWAQPARQDYFHKIPSLAAPVTYDSAYHVVVAGDRVYYGSSGDHAVHCLSGATGAELWTFRTEGPVRLAPAVAQGRVYAGSDDGHLYCLDAATGALLWRHRAGPEDRRLPGNGQLISRWPVRCGILAEGATVQYAAGLFPADGVFLLTLDAASGAERRRLPLKTSAQGNLTANAEVLVVPAGRTAGTACARDGSRILGPIKLRGGTTVTAYEDLIIDGQTEMGWINLVDPATREGFAPITAERVLAPGDAFIVLAGKTAQVYQRGPYLAAIRRIAALEQKGEAKLPEPEKAQLAAARAERDAARRWSVAITPSRAMVLAGDVLFLGGDRTVTAHRMDAGEKVWEASVDGRVESLAVAGGRLYASCDSGVIHCFAPAGAKPPQAQAMRAAAEPSDAASQALAKEVLVRSAVTAGFALVLGGGDGRLPLALERGSQLQIVVAEADPARVGVLRERFAKEGSRIRVHQVEAGRLPYVDSCMNLVTAGEVLGAAPGIAATEIQRVLRPYGGAVMLAARGPGMAAVAAWAGATFPGWTMRSEAGLAWGMAVRGALPGAGEWTHLYADPGNTACSGDRLVQGRMQVQWYGGPGPQDMTDRHHRAASPLCKDGRLFRLGDEVITAVDAYNGTVLWNLTVPGSRRLGVARDTGPMALTGTALYVAAGGSCWVVDPAQGARLAEIAVPGSGRRWGYVAALDGLLIGSAQSDTASMTTPAQHVFNMIEGDGRTAALSRSLFAIDVKTRRTVWEHAGGAILNPSITIGAGLVFFLEGRDPKLLGGKEDRVKLTAFMAGDAWLTALDLATGAQVWQRQVPLRFEQIGYLSCADGVLLATGSHNVEGLANYHLQAFDARSGADLWQTGFPGGKAGGAHGEQWQHPVLVAGKVHLLGGIFDLRSGAREKEPNAKWRSDASGGGCGIVSGSAGALFYRNKGPIMRDIATGASYDLTQVTRPGCWINILPAAGMVLIPEASAGCTCAYAIQTSIGLMPVTR